MIQDGRLSLARRWEGYNADVADDPSDAFDKFADAEQTLRGTLVIFTKNIRGDHQYIASAEHYLGEALLAQHKYGEAEVVLVAAIEHWKRTGAPIWRSARSGSALGADVGMLGAVFAARERLSGRGEWFL